MNFVSKMLGLVTVLASVNSFADSRYLDSKPMYDCGGRVELRESANGDLAIKFEGLNESRCGSLRFYDATSGRTLTSYNIQGTSYTLSKSHRSSLSDDCRVGFTVSGRYSSDRFEVVMPWCSGSSNGGGHGGGSNGKSYQLSNAGNCKLMVYGSYSNRNVSDVFCQGARQGDNVTYEYSNAGNCKRMINGGYSGQNVSSYMCTAN